MDPLTIRRAKVEDFPKITEIWMEMMDYHLSLDPRFEMDADCKEAYMEYLRSIITNYDYGIFVAEKNDVLIGYTISIILSNPAVFALERYGFIAEMSVTESEQHSGAGQLLWDYVRKWLYRRGISVIQLNVSPRNQKGYNFWKKMGCNEFLHIMWYDIPKNL